MDNNSVKENISRLRKASGISQSEMAEQLGMSRTAYRNLEKGETRLINGYVDKIAAILNKSTEEVVLGYSPALTDEKKVNDILAESFTREKDLVRTHETETALLKEKIKSLEDYIIALKETVKTKDEVISMLKRQASRD